MQDILARALVDLAEHPDSTAREIAQRLGVRDDRTVFKALDNAAYDGKCQRWHPGGSGGRLAVGNPAVPERTARLAGFQTRSDL